MKINVPEIKNLSRIPTALDYVFDKKYIKDIACNNCKINDGLITIDNTEIIKNRILNFEQPDDFYLLMILKRKKDSSKNKSDELLANYQITSKEYFDEIFPFIKEMCNTFHARAYIRPQVRSGLQINRAFLKVLVDELDNGKLIYTTLPIHVISSYHMSRAKRIVLDLDNKDVSFINNIYRELVRDFCLSGREAEIQDISILPTFSGYHIITPGFDPILLQNNGVIKEVFKSDANTLVYGVMEIEK